MARPQKAGLDYFPLDVGFFRDKKVRLLKAEFGAKGVVVVLLVLSKVYEEDGYFLRWDNDECLMMADAIGDGCTPAFVGEVIARCLQRSFFDERVFQVFGVLTSGGIQRRYLAAIGKNRDVIRIEGDYWLLDLDDPDDVPRAIRNKVTLKQGFPPENPSKNAENPDKPPENPTKKSKGKKNKEKESKEEKILPGDTAPDSNQVVISLPLNDKTFFDITEQQVKEWEALYPAVDVRQSLRNMLGWLGANPTKKKTRTGVLKFVVSWLMRDQNRGGSPRTMGASKEKELPGLVMEKHNYDPDYLESLFDKL